MWIKSKNIFYSGAQEFSMDYGLHIIFLVLWVEVSASYLNKNLITSIKIIKNYN